MRGFVVGVALAVAGAGCVDVEDGGTETADQSLVGACIGPGPFEAPILTQQQLFALLAQVPYYSQNLQLLYTGPWTNWSQDSLEIGLTKLAVMRGVLQVIAAHNTYLPGALQGNAAPELECAPETAFARTADGTCNDPENPLMGAANTRFGRNLPLPYTHPNPATLLVPNPRNVSRTVLHRTAHKEMSHLNMIGAAWTQFQIHDWFSHGENDPQGIISVPLDADDPLRDLGLTALNVRRTMPDPTRLPGEASLPPTYLNTETHWWDGSQIYGSAEATAARLRSFEGGKLEVTADGLLPALDSGQSDTGVTDNWWLGLELLHTLFVLEHNAIADMLAATHPEMDDQQLYDTARLINTALIARIHTLEWTPAILPNPTLQVAMHTNWAGLNQFLVPPFPFRGTDPVVFGIVGNPRDLGGVPYFLTEEFVSVYRMHPMLPEKLRMRTIGQPSQGPMLGTETTRGGAARTIAAGHGMADLAYAFGVQHSGALVLQNYPRFLQDLVMPFGVIDMGTIDILRDRERGVPRYNNARRLLALKPLTTFEELTGGNEELAATLSDAYGGDIEQVDFMVGMFAEGVRPECYGFSETAFQVFTLMATRRLQNDRFFTDDYRPAIYTQEGIDWVEGNTMKDVLLRHFPELADTGLAAVDNAFMPWE